MSNNGRNGKQGAESQELLIARLAFIGASISTLGDGISAIAAGLALEDLERSKYQGSQNSNDPSKQSESMQKEIDYIINELKQIKKMMK